tara:strand:- start:538 stop:873 length:336 start_codon:yes stop_codon:yes gene_type:complete
MKFKVPKKSIFGFRILNSLESTISAYLLIISSYFVSINFGYELIEIIAACLFFIIVNLSFLILLFNSFYRRKKSSIFSKIFDIPLLLHIPISFFIIIRSIYNLLKQSNINS